MPFTHVALGSNPAPSTNFLTMEKGDVIWIKKIDGSVFCSEFDHITYLCESSGSTRCSMQLVPIIGNCTRIFTWESDLKYDWNKNSFVVLATFDEERCHTSQYVRATLNIYGLFQ